MTRAKKAAPRRDTVVSAGVVATVLGVNTRTVQRLVAERILPKPVKHGYYDLAVIVPAYIEHRIEQAEETPGPPGSPRDRWWSARAQLMEVELATRLAHVVPAGDLTRTLEYFAASCRARLLALPRKLAAQLTPEDPHATEAILETEVRAILTELADDRALPAWLDDAGDDTPEPAGNRDGTPRRAGGSTAAA